VTLASNKKSPFSTAILGLTKVKLSIDESSIAPAPDSSWLLKEKPSDAERGVLSLTRKEENDDVNVGDGTC
jgi:hypothetical protein